MRSTKDACTRIHGYPVVCPGAVDVPKVMLSSLQDTLVFLETEEGRPRVFDPLDMENLILWKLLSPLFNVGIIGMELPMLLRCLSACTQSSSGISSTRSGHDAVSSISRVLRLNHSCITSCAGFGLQPRQLLEKPG